MLNRAALLAIATLVACNPTPVAGNAGSGGSVGAGTVGLSSSATNGNGVAVAVASSGASSGASGSVTASSTGGISNSATASSGAVSSSASSTSGAASSTGSPLPPVPDPTVNGRYGSEVGMATVTNATTHDNIQMIYAYPTASPDAGPPANGSCPLVVFAHGFLDDASAYQTYATRLATFGYWVVLPNYPDSNEVITSANDLQFVEDLMTAIPFAEGKVAESPSAYTLVDPSLVGISGHSLGGKLAILAAEQNPGVFKASIDFDPVDDTSCGANCPSAIAGLASLGIPTAFLGQTTDQGAACAPASDNFQLFYAAAPSPSLSGNVANAGDSSFVDDETACGAECLFCSDSNSTTTLSISHAMIVAFYERYLRGNTGYDAWLNGSLSTSTWVTPGEITFQSK